MFQKRLWLVAIFTLILSVAIGCSNDSENANSSSETDQANSAEDPNNTEEPENTDPVELDFVYTGDPAFRVAMDNILSSFADEYPNIIIKGESATDGSYSEYLRTKDATGESPDFFELRDVQEYVDSDKVAVIPEDLASLVKSPVVVDGNPYALPLEANALGYIYNKKFFEENNLNEEPKTYEEFLEVMQEIKDLGETPIAVGGQDVWHMGFWINHFLIQEVFSNNPDWNAQRNNGEVSWTDPEPKKAMQDFLDLFHSGVVSENWISTPDNQLAALVTSGKAIGFFSGPWMFSQLEEADPDFEIGYMPVPADNGDINLFTGGIATGLAISKDVEDDEVKMEAISTFIKHFYSTDVYTEYLETMNTLPATKEEITYESIPAQERLIETFNNANATISPINEMLGENQIPPSFRDWFYKTTQEWILNDVDLEEELPKLDEEWDRLKE